MPAKPVLYIHAGHPKCGSTTIRSLLRHHGEGLASHGYYLLGDRLEIAPDNDISDWPLWFVQNATKQAPGFLAAQLGQSLARHADLHPRALILSAENLSEPTTAALLDPVFEHFDTRLIYYMRRQDHFLVASWRQWALKRGLDFEQHVSRRIAEGKPDFAGTLKFWESRVRRGNIHARFVDPRFLTDGDLGRDFFAAIGLDVPPTTLKLEANRSPDRAILLYLQRNHQLFRDVHDDTPINLLAGLDTEPVMRMEIDRGLQNSIIAAYEQANQEILAGFGAPSHAGLPVVLPDSQIDQGEYGLTQRDRDRLDAIFAKLVQSQINRKPDTA